MCELAPIILALAERVGAMHNGLPKRKELNRLKQLLQDEDGESCEWVPLRATDEHFASVTEAFLPDLPHLDATKFSVVAASTADLSCPGATDDER